MPNKRSALAISLLLLLSFQTNLEAQTKPITLKFKTVPTGRLVVVGQNASTKSTSQIKKLTTLTTPDKLNRIYLLGSNGKVSAAITSPSCSQNKSTGKLTCTYKNTANVLFKAGCKLNSLKAQDGAYTAVFTKLSDYKACVNTSVRVASNGKGVPIGIKSFGSLASIGTTSVVKIKADALDPDGDGLIGNLDNDDDNDGKLDNYDSSSGSPVSGSTAFKVFSNLKLDIDQSLNQHSTGISTARIDAALAAVQTLAIQVAGTGTATTELDCGSLRYCSSGGTGSVANGSQPFPGTAGGTLDSDADGFGTVTRGSTGDFQLKTGASSTTIGAGDAYIERVTDSSGAETEVTGMLNFVFTGTPALQSVTVNGGAAQTVSYSSSPILGSRNNCIAVPASGNVSVALTGWRPQRFDSTGALIDIGNSLITVDIPNGPSSGGGSGSTGPGNCVSSSYSTSDTSLSVTTNGLQDSKADQTTSVSNTYSFTIDLTACLAATPSGAITWAAGETLFTDLQFRSLDGDNAAQKFCFTRATS